MRKLILALAIPFAALASSASAADWSGFYTGGATNTNTGDYHVFGTNPVFTDPTYGLSGSMTSIFGGFNVDNGPLVFGFEAATTVSGTTPSTTAPLTDYLTTVTDFKARAGYEMGNALIYGTAGYSFGNFELPSYSTAVSGFSYGVGVDFLVTLNFFVGVEYLSRNMFGVVLTPDELEVNLDSISIRAGMLF